MKILVVLCLGCSLVVISECQDLTALMFQAMGIESPMLPPAMPQSLREALYPRQRQQQLYEQQRLQLQKQRYLAYLASQQQRQQKENPYSTQYASRSNVQPRDNSVYSSANRIRHPGTANSAAFPKGNPYSVAYKDTTANKATSPSVSGNPYSVSRAGSSGVPAVRNSAQGASMAPVPIPPQATRLLRTMQTMKAVREHPRRITDAKSAGCALPGDSAAASMLMYNDCRSAASRMVCQIDMMTCVNVGMSAMCCPYGMNNLALDTIGYVNKLQHFVEALM